MSCYGPLAAWYDQLTGDVPYGDFADYYEELFYRDGGEFHTLLDLFCGTGTLTCEMARRGYEMIAVDASVDMLTQAQEKLDSMELPVAPMFLCQEAASLDLYGTVDAAYCSLDGMNYIPPEELPELFHRLQLFIKPGGLFIFDLRSPEWLESMDGQLYVDEQEDVLCLWRSELEDEAIYYGMDIFSREGELWRRDSEEHVEYIHRFKALQKLLSDEGFTDIELTAKAPQGELGRQFITAKRGLNLNGQNYQSNCRRQHD